MPASLTKPLIVPQYGNFANTVTAEGGLVKLYTPDPVSGLPTVNPAWTVNLQAILDTQLFPGAGRVACPNCCAVLGKDLFVALSSSTSQAVLKLPNYLADPATAIAQAFVFTLDATGSQLGLAFDAAGRLYTADGLAGGVNTIVRYGGTNAPYPGAALAKGNNYASKTPIGNAGVGSVFANLVFDHGGNLWATDAQNNRVVAFDATGLANGTNSFHVLPNLTGSLAVANTIAGLNSPTTALFNEPEGIDTDSFAGTANLWVANNNDNAGLALTTLVRITPALQALVLATPAGGTLSAAQVVPNTNVFIYQVPNGVGGRPQFGGLQVDKAAGRLYVNEELGKEGRAYDIATLAATPATPDASRLGIVSTNPGNGGIALLNLGPFIPDSLNDLGVEPSTDPAAIWESLAISVTQAPQLTGGVLPPTEDVRGGLACSLYVEVHNFGPRPTSGLETVEVYWANASTGLYWPQPWDGTVFDGPTNPTLPMGGLANSGIAVPVIPAFGRAIVGPFAWNGGAPDPNAYSNGFGHFCLLARIVTPGLGNQGLTTPQTTNLGADVRGNARIAWKNVHIVNPKTNKIRHPFGVIVANYTGATLPFQVTFEVAGSDGAVLGRPGGTITIGATGLSRRALAGTSLGLSQDGPATLPGLNGGIGPLELGAGERVSFDAEYHPPADGTEGATADGFVLRAMQSDLSTTPPTLVGGQSFVSGTVKGFRIRRDAPPVARPPKPKGPPRWLLYVLLAFLLGRCMG